MNSTIYPSFEAAWKLRETTDFPFLCKQREEMSTSSCYKGLKILHHIPLSVETVIKLEPLLAAGAEVTVTPTDFLKPQTQTESEKLLAEIGIRYEATVPMDEIYDLHLDCSAELLKAPRPRLGIVELTQTGSELYQKSTSPVPILSVDDSRLKQLETFFGTGDGFARAFRELSGEAIAEHRFILFGYGKVGQGVAHALKENRAKIAVVDISDHALSLAVSRGHAAFHLTDIEGIRAAIEKATAVVTATGIQDFISKHFRDTQCFVGKILANVGAEDEFGDDFKGEVLNDRIPINFALKEPTANHYLDPIFYAHNLAGQIIIEQELEPGYHPLPEEHDKWILDEWSRIHNESLDLISTDHR